MGKKTKLGIIGGSGLYQLEGLNLLDRKEVETPFGKPSSALSVARWQGNGNELEIVFLPRHGEKHQILPGEINYCANLWALKSLGVDAVLSVSACGSLREALAPGHFAVASQYLDFTKGKRRASFFGDGMVGHVSSADPACSRLTAELRSLSEPEMHFDKTYLCVEGPRLGTRAESHAWRTLGADIVGMTNVPEAFLALEARLSYVTLAVVTDYDCWKEGEEVTLEHVFSQYRRSLGRVQKLLMKLFDRFCERSDQEWIRPAGAGSPATHADCLNQKQREMLEFLNA